MIVEKQRYTESTPGILEPKYKEEIFALLEDPKSEPPVDHPLFERSWPGMQILYKCISDRTGVINDKFEKILFPAKTTGYRFQNNFLLHHEYTIPKGFDPYWFESFCWYMLWARKREILTPMSWGQVLDLRGEIVLLNPTLDVFTPRISPETVYHILCGVASQFTVDDIWYFVFERFPKGGVILHSNNMDDLLIQASKHYPINSWGYVPSPKTIEHIRGQLQLPQYQGTLTM